MIWNSFWNGAFGAAGNTTHRQLASASVFELLSQVGSTDRMPHHFVYLFEEIELYLYRLGGEDCISSPFNHIGRWNSCLETTQRRGAKWVYSIPSKAFNTSTSSSSARRGDSASIQAFIPD